MPTPPPKTVYVTITRGTEGWLVECEWFNLYAWGRTIEEALDDFSTMFAEMKAHYAKTPRDKLIGQGLVLKERYEQTGRDKRIAELE